MPSVDDPTAKLDFLKAKGITVGEQKEAGKAPYLAYVIALGSELDDTETVNRLTAAEVECDRLRAEVDRLRLRVLTAAGGDLCRLTQDEIKAYASGAVKIPPEDEFIPSCKRFHAQIAGTAGVLDNCLTLAQMIAENERVLIDNERLAGNERAAVTEAQAEQRKRWDVQNELDDLKTAMNVCLPAVEHTLTCAYILRGDACTCPRGRLDALLNPKPADKDE